MLVLTRKLGENIRIGDTVKITVLEVHNTQVKLGIEAPPEVRVHREEIYRRIQAESRQVREPDSATSEKPPPETRAAGNSPKQKIFPLRRPSSR